MKNNITGLPYQVLKIGIADQHILFRKGLAALLTATHNSKIKFDIIIDAATGNELLDYLHKAESIPDICLLGIRMEQKNGYVIMNEVYSKWPKIKVLIIYDYANEFSMAEMFRAGARGFLKKSESPAELINAIISIHTTGDYHPAHQAATIRKIMNPQTRNELSLSEKEKKFLQLCCSSKTYKNIASEMNKSPDTIKDICNGLFKKLNVTTRQELVIFAIEIGLFH